MTQETSELVTTNRTYLLLSVNVFDLFNLGSSGVHFDNSVIADMDAADTARYNITVSGGAGNTAFLRIGFSRMSGKLIC